MSSTLTPLLREPPHGRILESMVFRSITDDSYTRLFRIPDNGSAEQLLGRWPSITAPIRGYLHGTDTPWGRLATAVIATATGYVGQGLPKPPNPGGFVPVI